MAESTPVSRALPERPNLDHLRKQAKERLWEIQQDRSDAQLHDAQLEVARSYGYPSWRALKAYVDEINETRYRPFVVAIEQGDVAAVVKALAEDPGLVRAPLNPHRRSALHLAAWQGKTEIARVLLDHDADPNARDRGDNAYPTHFAAELGYLEIVKMLIDAGGDARGGGDTHGLGVLGWATCFDQVRHEVAEFLLSCGAKHHIFSAVSMNDAKAVRQVVDQDPTALTRPMSRFENHRTPLHHAVMKRKYDMIDLLLELGADPYLTDKNQQTAPHIAIVRSDAEALVRFEQRGVEFDQFTEQSAPFSGVTPILSVRDVEASIKYYVEKMGFTKQWDWDDPIGFASVQRGEVTIFLSRDGQGQSGTWMSIWLEDVDALYEEFKKRGAIIKQPPTNFPWGCREMNVADPDGHRFRMSSSVTGEPDGVPLCED